MFSGRVGKCNTIDSEIFTDVYVSASRMRLVHDQGVSISGVVPYSAKCARSPAV